MSSTSAVAGSTIRGRTEAAPSVTAALSFRQSIAALSGLVSLLGCFFRFGPRDSIQSLAWVFYATPQAVIVGCALLTWVLVRKSQRLSKLPRTVVFLFAAGQLGLLVTDCKSAPPVDREIRLGLWNVCSGNMGWDGVVEEIQSWDADIIGLAESTLEYAQDDSENRSRFWEQKFPAHNVLQLRGGMRLITRYPARIVSQGKLEELSTYGIVELQVGEDQVYVVMADLLSSPHLPRGPALRALRQRIASLPAAPVIVMGDMNTPTESVHFDPFREDFRNAFEETGNGFYHTWPMPCPVLPLDQVWVNDQIKLGSSSLGWTMRSDHRPLLTSFSVTTDSD